jgi:dihydroorotate dehydrogenase
MGLGFGAVTTKSITLTPRPGHPRPNLARVRTSAGPGLVNCNGFQNPGRAEFRHALQGLHHRVPVIVSVAAESAEDYLALVRDPGDLGDLIEINVSSPNTRLVYAWNERPRELRAMLEAARAASPRPLVVKLSPDFAEANALEIIPAALEAGVRIINYGNTRRVEDRRLSQGSGGLSGPELFEATLANVQATRARFGTEFDLIATGGIDAPDKAHALLDAGATALGLFTGFITRGPVLVRQILDHLLDRRTAR